MYLPRPLIHILASALPDMCLLKNFIKKHMASQLMCLQQNVIELDLI